MLLQKKGAISRARTVEIELQQTANLQIPCLADAKSSQSTAGTAYDVSLTDDSWGHDKFDIISGSISKTWERLDGGASVSHSIVLDSQVKGVFQGSPAVIKYRVPTKAALQEALSTPIPPLDILADRPPEKKFEWAKRLVAKYGSLVSVLTFVGLFIYTVASPSKSVAKANKRKR